MKSVLTLAMLAAFGLSFASTGCTTHKETEHDKTWTGKDRVKETTVKENPMTGDKSVEKKEMKH